MQCLYIVLSGHTTIADMPENLMVNAKIMNLLLFCPKLHKLSLPPMWVIFDFAAIQETLNGQHFFSKKPLFVEYMYQILCFYHKLTYYGFGY